MYFSGHSGLRNAKAQDAFSTPRTRSTVLVVVSHRHATVARDTPWLLIDAEISSERRDSSEYVRMVLLLPSSYTTAVLDGYRSTVASTQPCNVDMFRSTEAGLVGSFLSHLQTLGRHAASSSLREREASGVPCKRLCIITFCIRL